MGCDFAANFHQLFEQRVGSAPDGIAVCSRDHAVSYGALDRRSNQLAHYLRELGVGPETRTGICLGHDSPDAFVAVLGVLKAGGSYLPLDPAYPRARLRRMMQDAGTTAVVTERRLGERLGLGQADPAAETPALGSGGGPAPAVVWVDRDREAIGDRPDSSPGLPLDGRSLAYVIYTSGSTGRPKGVMVSHLGIAGLCRAHAEAWAPSASDRVVQFASLSFDASVWEMVAAWGAGATLCLGAAEELLPGPRLIGFLREQAITVATLPPSSLAALPHHELPALRALVTAGEPVARRLVDGWAPGRRFFNAYGPSEATVCATIQECRPGDAGAPPIGFALAGFRVHLLDRELEPVADGDVGEICLGGAALARGYLGLPARTAERFVPDPLARTPGERLYRTGDLARRLPDGSLLYLGRADHQVKVRGVRIEPGEVESHLRRHPAVDAAVVVARPDAQGDQRLVAYLRGHGAPMPSTTELRDYLGRELPEHMLPSRTVVVDDFPLGLTGKIDRSALPDPDRAADTSPPTAPRTELERSLLAIWRELFAEPQLGIDHGFFELGGHSLLATRISARIRERLGVEVPPLGLFSLSPPTVGELAAAIAEGRWSDAAARRLPPLSRAPREGDHPASSGQEQVWFLHQLAPRSLAYHAQVTLHLSGALDVAALSGALTRIVQRHEIYRTSFVPADGRLRQRVRPPSAVRVPVIDLRAVDAGRRERVSEELVARESRRGIEPASDRLVRWSLLRLAADEHVLIQVEHHFVHDGWSFAVLLRELMAIYGSSTGHAEAAPAEPRFQFSDFARWQRDCLGSGALDGQLEYWRRRLAGSPPLLELPADRPRPPVPSFRGDQLQIELGPELDAAVDRLARRRGVSYFVVMLSAFLVLLQRYTHRDDLVVGSAVANRRLRETEDLIGMLVNTIALRCDLGGDPPVGELLQRVQRVVEEGHDHQELPFERLVEELHPDRDLSRNPLIQTLFSFHDSPVPEISFSGLSGQVVERHNGSAKFDLNVIGIPRRRHRSGATPGSDDRTFTLLWEYSSDLFDRAPMERMAGHYRNLLTAIAGRSEARLSSLPMLGGDELQRLESWAQGTAERGPRAPVPDLVAEQAQRRPDAAAVTQGRRVLTYGELDRRALRLSGILRRLGAGVEQRVGVCLERSPALVAAWLGVWKAGAACVSLDPRAPIERLRSMIEDAGVRLVLTAPDRASTLADPRWQCLALGEGGLPLAPAPAGERGAPATASPDGRQLAYVIYTSGSTGRPKGVAVDHAALGRLVRWHLSAFATGPGDRATQGAGLGFDASVWETWPCLAAGGTLRLAEDAGWIDPEKLRDRLVAEEITISFQATPLAERLIELEWPSRCALRWLLTGGDLLHRHPPPGLPFALVNNYGPTESTVVATSVVIPAGRDRVPPIGHPIAGTRARVLDRRLEPVPPGVVGELCLGGSGLARGYLGRPAATAARFVPDPAGAAGARLYRTGDLVRHRSGGELEFLGRADHQVQIRGHRVELAEVEAELGAQPGVEACAVAVDGAGESARLAAYVVGDRAAAELRRALRGRLPDYMVPAVFVHLPELPVTASGKLDRRALPPPPADRPGSGGAPPETATEKLLAEIWRDVLEVDRIAADDDFFELGGHSLLASRVASRVRERFEIALPLPRFFSSPTLGGLAEEIETLILEEIDRTALQRSATIPGPLTEGVA